MLAQGLSSVAIGTFKRNYEQLVAGVTGLVPEADIAPVSDLPHLSGMTQAPPHSLKVQALGCTSGFGCVTCRMAHGAVRDLRPSMSEGSSLRLQLVFPPIHTSLCAPSQEILAKTAMLKLNGGLGTSMGRTHWKEGLWG